MVHTVETKYYIGDRVWLVSNNKVVEKIITQFDVVVSDNGIKITYELNYESIDIDESKLFTSKEELLKSL